MAIHIEHHNSPSHIHTHKVFLYRKTIYTTVTNDPTVVSRWISNIKSKKCYNLHKRSVGLDVSSHQNQVATLQLCAGKFCLIYQIIHSRYVPSSLINFLNDQRYTFVGVGIYSNLQKLKNDYGLGKHARTVDLNRQAARVCNRTDMMNAELKRLAKMVLNIQAEYPEIVTLSDWDNQRLTDDQVQYACVDAYLSFATGRTLNRWDKDLGLFFFISLVGVLVFLIKILGYFS